MAEIKVDPFHALADREGFFLPRKNGIAFFIDGKYRYRSYSDEFRGWLDEQTGKVRKVFGNEHYDTPHKIGTDFVSFGRFIIRTDLVDGGLMVRYRSSDNRVIDVLK